jgi:hypothetical protein
MLCQSPFNIPIYSLQFPYMYTHYPQQVSEISSMSNHLILSLTLSIPTYTCLSTVLFYIYHSPHFSSDFTKSGFLESDVICMYNLVVNDNS